ncbi:glycosyltransferase family 4 protein [Alcanivorax sp. S6407]|uniref:glycosyltransferase family 4 protein n=1 Tax=Alcanivorax sp. S6407 TaxID=2926424 RepID=UPI001FF6DD00|nr:glycosyltransferase family 4 protein [Alcanivorax sp. S6407]MCK0153646.1 glycosyltransferase family 4 protein [Alcanivorax sp. S6407]
MKMAFALFEYFPYGGLQRDMLAIARRAVEKGHQVTIFTRSWDGEPAPDAIRVQLLPVSASSNHGRDKAFAQQVAQLWGGFDLRVGFNKMPGLDWYYAADGCLAERYRFPRSLLPRYRSKLAMENAVFGVKSQTRILSISPPQMQLFMDHYQTPDARFVSLPPGIRRDRVLPEDFANQREAFRAELGLGDDEPMLLFVGSGFRTKGLDRAIEIVASLDAGQLYIVGDDKADRFQALADKLGAAERVHFMGGQDNVPLWLWSADLLLHPAYAENTGTVLLEAAIGGLPVLTTRACGYSPYIEQAGMGRVMDNEADRDAMASAARDMLACDRDDWRHKGRAFARTGDIYDLVEHAVSALEGGAAVTE